MCEKQVIFLMIPDGKKIALTCCEKSSYVI